MLFSVIVPMYNVEKYCEKCIKSILGQSFDDYELIIVDDGSADGTKDVIDRYCDHDSRIKCIHKVNGGLVSARKAGMSVAKGDYVVVVDGDDSIESDYLQNFADEIAVSHPDIVIAGATRSDGHVISNGYDQIVRLSSAEQIQKALFPRLMMLSPTLWGKTFKLDFYRKMQNCIADFISMGEDGCVTYPLIASASSVSFIPCFGYNYQINDMSITRTKKKRIPYASASWRVSHFRDTLPDSDVIRNQISLYAVRSFINVFRTNIRYESFIKVRNNMRKEIADHNLKLYFHGIPHGIAFKDAIVFLALKIFAVLK